MHVDGEALELFMGRVIWKLKAALYTFCKVKHWFSLQHFIMKNFKHTAKVKEFYSEQLYTQHLDSTINI